MNDDLNGQRLGTGLRDHMGQRPYAPLDLDDVKSTAGRIRRRRTWTGVTVAAVAAAALTPAAFLLPDEGSNPAPAGPGIEAPETPAPRGDVTLAPSAPRGDDAEDWWVVGEENAGVPAASLPQGADRVSPLGKRWLVSSRTNDGPQLLTLLDPDGSVVTKLPLGGNFVVSEGRDLAALLDADGLMHLMDESGATRVFAKMPRPSPSVVALRGGAECMEQEWTSDCRVLVNHGDERGPDMVTETSKFTQIDPRAQQADAANGSVVALRDRLVDGAEAPCTRVVDLETGPLWESCDLSVRSFSPDGRLVQVVDAYQSGWAPTRVGIADATTGELLFWITPDAKGSGVPRIAWEGSDHLTISTYDFGSREWRLFRVSTTGEVEQAAEPVQGDEMAFPFVAPARPRGASL